MRLKFFGFLLLALGVTTGCQSEQTIHEDMELGGVKYTAAYLNEGRKLYVQNCYACHGHEGDGKGPAAAYLRPPPRNFQAGIFKFGGVAAGDLPHTQDLVTLVKHGLNGTAMLPWDLSDKQLTNIVDYIKVFSSERYPESAKRWSEGKPSERILPTEDPWKGKEAEAIERGKRVYHVNAQCKNCHPIYISKPELAQLTKEEYEMVLTEIPDDQYRPALKDSPVYGVKILPPDFLYHPIKNVQPFDTEEEAMNNLYRAITAGIGGTAMPVWKGALTEEDLWAITHYVMSIYELRGTPEGRKLRVELLNQPPYQPEGEPEEEGTDPGTDDDASATEEG